MPELPAARPALDPDRLRSAPWPVEVLPEAGSTNALLAERARGGAGPQVLVTEHQTAGRGRLDRVWVTPARAALTFSVLLRPAIEPEQWPWLPLLAGLACRCLPGQPRLKWPNDVLLGDRKVAGVLVERVEAPQHQLGPAAVIGVGINVSTTPEELPIPEATSLAIEGHEVDRTDLLLDWLGELDRVLAEWLRYPARSRASYRQLCATIGRNVQVALPAGGTLTGVAEDVDPGGRLVVRTGTGTVPVGAGDVMHVRTAAG